MTDHPSDVISARSRLGVAARKGDPTAIAEARRNLAAANIAAYIAKVLADAPPLEPWQRERIVQILGQGGTGK